MIYTGIIIDKMLKIPEIMFGEGKNMWADL